jgi:hypothetical protein
MLRITSKHGGGGISLFILAVFTILCVASQPANAASFNYSASADFDLGISDGVNHDPPNDNQLQLNQVAAEFSVLWIANAGEDSISKIDAEKNVEIARYRTWFNGPTHPVNQGAAPSRTAVDKDYNVYVANQHYDGKPALVMKILTDGGIDRNSNGIIDTSKDVNGNGKIDSDEVIPLVDANANGIIDQNEIADERVAWAVQVGPEGGLARALCIDPDGLVWVGLYNTSTYYVLNPVDGTPLEGPISAGLRPFGCAVDGAGRLWTADGGSNLGELDTKTLQATVRPHSGTTDKNTVVALGNGKVYLGTAKRYIEYAPATETKPGGFAYPNTIQTANFGIALDSAGNIVYGGPSPGNFLFKYTPANPPVSLWNPFVLHTGTDARGIIADDNDNIWVVNRGSNNIVKYNPDGTRLTTVAVGLGPDTYSDAAGFGYEYSTLPSGTWTVVTDSSGSDTPWQRISWNESVPEGTSIQVSARAANESQSLSDLPYEPVSNGADLSVSLNGRFIQIQVGFTANTDGASPILSGLTVESFEPEPVPGDLTGDGILDIADYYAFIGTYARCAGDEGYLPAADYNGDSCINVADFRIDKDQDGQRGETS